MDDIRRQFQKTSIEFLKKSSAELQKQETLSVEFQQEIFRRLHTIKGSAQTFGLVNTASLAHDLENVLELFRKNPGVKNKYRDLLVEGFKFIVLSLEYPEFTIPESFIEKIEMHLLQPPQPPLGDVFLTLIPPEIYDQLTEYEKIKLREVSDKDKTLLSIDAVFDSSDFIGKLKELQDNLSLCGEIIFTLPSEKKHRASEIGFQIFLSTDEGIEKIEHSVKEFNVDIDILTAPANFSNDIVGVLSKIVSQGKIWANSLGKKAKFKALSDEPKLDAKSLSLIFEILLHLVRNAIDHSFEKKGKIDIRLEETDGGINLIFSDNGKGIDPFVIRAKAIEQNLILSDTHLSDEETLDLIFLPGFSTAEKVTGISGRGVGLDTVQNLVVNAKGTINVESRKDEGTVFEIFLPLDSDYQ